jgi:hypothetical protein
MHAERLARGLAGRTIRRPDKRPSQSITKNDACAWRAAKREDL